MADKLVSVNDDFDFPAPVAARQAARLGDEGTAEGAAIRASVTGGLKEAAAPLGGLTRTTNLLPRPSTTVASDWFSNNFGTGGVGTKGITPGIGHNGRSAYVMKWTTASTAAGTNTGPQIEISPTAHAAVTPGAPVTASVYIEAVDTAADVNVFVRVFFKDSAGATILSAGSEVLTVRKNLGPQRVYAPTTQAPPGTVKSFVNVTVWTATQVGVGELRFSAPQITQGAGTVPYRDGNYPDARWIGAADNSTSMAIPARFDRIACFGDSHFQMAYGGGHPLPAHVAALLPGIEVINAGRGGEPSTGIAVRAGAISLKVASPVTIPAGVEAVPLSITPNSTFRGTGAWPFLGELAGVGGTLRISENAWTFTRTAAGEATPVPAGTTFIPYGVPRAADVWLLMAGNNLHSFADVRRDTEAFVQACKNDGRNYLIQSLYNNNDEPIGSAGYKDVIAINEANEAAYPGHYIDVRRILIDQGLALLGITPTAADKTAINEDRIPPSLMADTVHLTDDARRFIVAPLLVQTMRRRGMIPA